MRRRVHASAGGGPGAGMDLARWGTAEKRRGAPAALLVGVLLGALLLAALRMDIVRMRYAKTEALELQAALRREQAERVVEVRQLRDPARLARLAAEQGFAPPERRLRLSGRGAVPTPAADGAP